MTQSIRMIHSMPSDEIKEMTKMANGFLVISMLDVRQ